ncbi:hypothetical protein JCM1840_004857 [Sporobolomyces johnsonii]
MSDPFDLSAPSASSSSLPPSYLASSSRPPSPSPFAGTSLDHFAGLPSLPPSAFDPSAAFSAALDPTPSSSNSSLNSQPSYATRSSAAMMTRAASGSGSATPGAAGGSSSSVPPIISYDPMLGSPSDDEADSDDADAGVAGRPRKRKSTRDLRSAAASQASASGAGGAQAKVDDDKEEDKGRRKIQIEYIEEKSKRHITFSKRKAGIMKKAYELSTLTGTQVLLLVVSESGWVYTFTTDKFKPLVKEDENGQLSQGQKLIAACLEAREGSPNLSASYQPTTASSTGNFEANSAVHGGQISLKTGQRSLRPTATNRRVSSKGRNHIPAAIHTGAALPPDTLPCPPGSGGQGGIPPVPQLPTPLSGGYLDPLASPISPRNPRSLSHPPVSPARPGYGTMQQQQAQAYAQGQAAQDYAEMMQRADMLQLQGQYDQSQQQQQQHYDMYGPTTSMSSGHVPLMSMHDPHSAFPSSLPHPPAHHSQQQQQQQQQYSAPQTPHRTLHSQRSHPHLQHTHSSDSVPLASSAYNDLYGPPPPHDVGPGNYTHQRDPSVGSQYSATGGGGGGAGMDPRQGGGSGYQTPLHHSGAAGSVHGTPQGQGHGGLVYGQQQQQDEQYVHRHSVV